MATTSAGFGVYCFAMAGDAPHPCYCGLAAMGIVAMLSIVFTAMFKAFAP
jgi:hypothetical protein